MMDIYALSALVLAAIATDASRICGLLLGGYLQPDNFITRWITTMAYALFAGLIARIVFVPYSPLGDTPTAFKVISVAVGLAAFFLFRRNTAIGVFASVTLFLLLNQRAG